MPATVFQVTPLASAFDEGTDLGDVEAPERDHRSGALSGFVLPSGGHDLVDVRHRVHPGALLKFAHLFGAFVFFVRQELRVERTVHQSANVEPADDIGLGRQGQSFDGERPHGRAGGAQEAQPETGAHSGGHDEGGDSDDEAAAFHGASRVQMA